MYTAAHGPIQYPGNPLYSTGPWGDNGTSTVITLMDTGIGEIVATLKKNETLWNNTLLVFFTDQGSATIRYNFPLRGGKDTLFEGGVRSVGFVSGGYITSNGYGGRITNDFMHVSDLYKNPFLSYESAKLV